ncbi:tetratricopeptide repeat protein [Oculatella sp. LEGE 06141]|uniref:tetratricopeptide repeat protein n=1 Tax=Oculatella sp. LEGE 06141 TaxID=1828648 RepID=UPI001882F5D6|nr:tetratricopeptide repeat protein [Oculatella sp. LEGE 06141]MBE9181894.1 tetratricopeptide repeat protein [Oculatella sp. LEGE 06141]
MQAVDAEPDNWRNYQKLMAALESSEGILNLLIAVCDDRNLREDLIQQYEAELQQQGIRPYRVRLPWQQPSLRSTLLQLVQSDDYLQQGYPAAITVLGIDDLITVKLDAERSEQERFFFSLQWTRESLREFRYPIVLWLTNPVLVRMAQRAPDFWSWRGGVFWFTGQVKANEPVAAMPLPTFSITSRADSDGLPLEELKQLIATTEAEQGSNAPILATLYDSLGRTYASRWLKGQAIDHPQERQLGIQALEKAIALQTELGLEADLVSSFERLGDLYFRLRDNVSKALELYQHAYDLAKKLGDRLGEAHALKAIGDVLEFLDRRSEALDNYEQALNFYCELGDRLGEAYTLLAIGDVLRFLRRSGEALANYEQALSLYRELGDRLGEAHTLKEIGGVLRFLARHTEALANYEQALSLYRELGDRLGEAHTLAAIGDILRFLARHTEALANYEQALSLYREINSRFDEAHTLLAIGDVLQRLKRSNEALANYEQALNLYREINSRLGEANTLAAIGDVLRFLNRNSKALSNYEQALSFYREVGDRLGEARTLKEIGQLYFSQGHYQQSIELYQQSLNISHQIGDRYNEAVTLYILAHALVRVDQKWEAVNAYQDARNLFDRLGFQNDVEKCNAVILNIGQKIVVERHTAPQIGDDSLPKNQKCRSGGFLRWLVACWQIFRRWFR